MGGRASFKLFDLRFSFILITFIILIANGPCHVVAEPDDTGETHPPSPHPGDGGGVGDIKPPPLTPIAPQPPPGDSNGRGKPSPFKPSVAVIVGVLTTMFSVTFLLLLYVRHCKHGNVAVIAGFGGNPSSRRPPASAGRKNSGIDRAVIESLPIFRFGSLMGQKDGLECAVCLTRFESTEVLRLLPKCKHAFHVECIDTWLDAHSTCPLCRYRVDPEDILLLEEAKILPQTQPIPPLPDNNQAHVADIESGRNGPESEPWDRIESSPGLRRVSGRHSSGDERGVGFLEVILEKGNSDKSTQQNTTAMTTTFRRSLDSVTTLRKKSEAVTVGCFDRPRKDGLLLTSLERRLEHRIIVSPSPRCSGLHQRWSDVQASDLLYLTSEMIISDSRRFSSSLSGSRRRRQQQAQNMHGGGEAEAEAEGRREKRIDESSWDGRGVINSRSVSEITGLSRLGSNNSNRNRREGHHQEEQQRHAGVVSRWLAWISQSQAQPAVR